MADRTEEQKLSQEPLVVLLGGKEHKVKLLSIKDSRAWRADVSELLASLPQYMNITTDDPEGFGQAMSALIGSMPDKIVELFFKYAKELNREELEAVANDQEIAIAFEQVADVAFPLVGGLSVLAEKIAGTTPSEPPLNSS